MNYMYIEGCRVETDMSISERVEQFKSMNDYAQVEFAAHNPVEMAHLLRSVGS